MTSTFLNAFHDLLATVAAQERRLLVAKADRMAAEDMVSELNALQRAPVVDLDVGGTAFRTLRATLCETAAAVDSMLAVLVGGPFADAAEEEHFLDRDPTFFSDILSV